MNPNQDENVTLWSQLHGQMFNRKIERGMLVVPKIFLENCSVTGSKNPKSNKAFRKVAYDKAYVIEILIKRVIIPLWPMKWNDYQALLSEAYKEHKLRLEIEGKKSEQNTNNTKGQE